MIATTPPTDQRAGVRPIAFALQLGQDISSPVVLKIRPEDLVRTEPARAVVHQTLGRGTQGWVDNFGQGLPSCRISGHTGWRASTTTGQDGAQAFETLNQLVMHDFHLAKQLAIEEGSDPADVQLLFIDMLDNFCWSVQPMVFELKRNKQRPLLFQYNMFLQAVSTEIDNPFVVAPFRGTIPGGLGALKGVLGKLFGFVDKVKGWVGQAVAFKDKLLAPIAATVSRFTSMAHSVFGAVGEMVSSVKNGVGSYVNSAIGIASDLASVGVGIYRTISSITGLPAYLKASLSRVGSAFNEVLCIFKNSLRPRATYADYDGLFGASNCSSTTGGRDPSMYANSNAFSLMQPEKGPFEISNQAYAGVSALNRMDPVLAPMSLSEVGRNVDAINNGLKVNP